MVAWPLTHAAFVNDEGDVSPSSDLPIADDEIADNAVCRVRAPSRPQAGNPHSQSPGSWSPIERYLCWLLQPTFGMKKGRGYEVETAPGYMVNGVMSWGFWIRAPPTMTIYRR
jgi:hypothetical protein